jgi:carbamoyltransferase
VNVLGISCFYHDAAAALVKDGVLVAAAAEERFNRKKHYFGFPKLAIDYCLREAGLTLADLDAIAFYEKPFVKFERILMTFLASWPLSYVSFLKAMPLWLKGRLNLRDMIRKELSLEEDSVDIVFPEHHVSHAASAFLVSPFEKAAILTLDGVGEWGTTTLGWGEGSSMTIEKEIRFPHSLGLFYSAITSYLGFRVNDAEWKVMGLAPYGKPKHVDKLKNTIDLRADGSFRLDMRYYCHHWSSHRMFNRRWEALLGAPQRKPETKIEEFHCDVAHSGQKIVEEAMVSLARAAHERYGLENLCIAGGVGLNCVGNWKILKQTPIKRLWIQPAAGDDGGAIGAAVYVSNTLMGVPRKYEMKHAYLGPSFTDAEIAAALEKLGVEAKPLAREEMLRRTAKLIAENRVVGWFQGRMEFGPRALGARSILANPTHPQIKDIINSKIKFRERFRPFAPSVLRDKVSTYFDMDMDCKFMLLVPEVLPSKRALLPGITHADGTGRVQTVAREDSPLYHDLIAEFEKLTGVPIVVNTSFNVRGEPIVCTPEDAYDTFMKTGMDALAIGSFVLEKDEKMREESDQASVAAARAAVESDLLID